MPHSLRMADNTTEQTQCQVCFTRFGTNQKLRDHVGAFQFEANQLMARLREVQIHLPPLDEQVRSCRDGYYDADDDADDTETDDCQPEGAHPGGLFCPEPGCKRKKSFKTKQDQIRHYETRTDVDCYEICVFCRDTFVKVRKYIAHKCKAEPRQPDESKEFYRKERCIQLRRYAIEKLDQILAKNDSLSAQEDPRKRGRDALDDWPNEHQPCKRSWISNDSCGFGVEFAIPIELGMPVYPTPAPTITTHLESSAPASSVFPNTECLSGTDFLFMEGPSTFSPGRMRAPIFQTATIPPWYGPGQQPQSQSFPEDILNSSYPVVTQFNSQC